MSAYLFFYKLFENIFTGKVLDFSENLELYIESQVKAMITEKAVSLKIVATFYAVLI